MTSQFKVRSSYRHEGLYRFWDWFFSILLCMAFALILFFGAFRPYSISGEWFRELERDEIVLVDCIGKYLYEFERGDIIVYDGGDGDVFGRIIAFSGEELTIREGRAYIGGAYLDESAYGGAFGEQTELSLTIPEGCILTLPDERGEIDGSSLEKYIINKSSIRGEVRMSIFPVRRIRIFQ